MYVHAIIKGRICIVINIMYPIVQYYVVYSSHDSENLAWINNTSGIHFANRVDTSAAVQIMLSFLHVQYGGF